MTESSANEKALYDLEERTGSFGREIIRFVRTVSLTVITRPLIDQLVRSGTSIGANYCEANDAESKNDFKHKIGICRKETRETMHWLRMITEASPENTKEVQRLWQEAKELNLIFSAIVRSTAGIRHSHSDAHH